MVVLSALDGSAASRAPTQERAHSLCPCTATGECQRRSRPCPRKETEVGLAFTHAIRPGGAAKCSTKQALSGVPRPESSLRPSVAVTARWPPHGGGGHRRTGALTQGRSQASGSGYAAPGRASRDLEPHQVHSRRELRPRLISSSQATVCTRAPELRSANWCTTRPWRSYTASVSGPARSISSVKTSPPRPGLGAARSEARDRRYRRPEPGPAGRCR